MPDALLDRIASAQSLQDLESVRVSLLGKSGEITAKLKSLGAMDPDTRASEAPKIHALREQVADALANRKFTLENAELERRLAGERIDLSLPSPDRPTGTVHPISQVMDELAEIFADLGFSVAEGPEIETQWYNFTALNMGFRLSRWATMLASGAAALTRFPIATRSAAAPASKLTSVGTGRSGLSASAPSQRRRVLRISASGTASAPVTPGADLSAVSTEGRRPPSETWTEYRCSAAFAIALAVFDSARPAAATMTIEKLMMAISQGVGPLIPLRSASRRRCAGDARSQSSISAAHRSECWADCEARPWGRPPNRSPAGSSARPRYP